jgi:membrane-associated protease RseP (regulator of RpoE activity)
MNFRAFIPLRSRSTIFIAAATAWFALSGAAQPSPDSIRAFYGRVFRIQTITRPILAASIQSCPARKDDFGFTSVSPDPDASATTQMAWASALGLGEGSTVLAVFPGGPAQAAGLRVGDHIVTVDNVHWQAAGDGRRAFAQAMATGQQQQLLSLSVNRGTENLAITMSAQRICAGEAVLTANTKVNASTTGTTIVVEGGLEQLLSDDDELAAVIVARRLRSPVGVNYDGR